MATELNCKGEHAVHPGPVSGSCRALGPLPEAEMGKSSGRITGDEMSAVQALLRVFSTTPPPPPPDLQKQLKAADHSPKLGAHPTERNVAEACVHILFVFVSFGIPDMKAGKYSKYLKLEKLSPFLVNIKTLIFTLKKKLNCPALVQKTPTFERLVDNQINCSLG